MMGKENITLVVPTCRPEQFHDFLTAWEPHRWWDRLIVVEDQPERTPGLAPGYALHVSWKEIDEQLGDRAWIISRRDSAIRSFGFLMAYQWDTDWIVTLDDDVRPDPGYENLGQWHTRSVPRWVSSCPGLRVRGLPYLDLGTVPVDISIGLWSLVPDLDAITTLSRGLPVSWAPAKGRHLVPAFQLVPMCGMNLAFRASLAPLFYFGLQGRDQPFRRFDDIWCGCWVQRIAQHLGRTVAVGEPHVVHLRASDPLKNLVAEAPGVAAHERYWRIFDNVPLTASNEICCMREFSVALCAGKETRDDPYLAKLGGAIHGWVELCDQQIGA